MEEPPQKLLQIISNYNSIISFEQSDLPSVLIALLCIVILLILSAVISSSENAFFSLTKSQLATLVEKQSRTSSAVNFLTRYPQKLLATILIANNFVNVGVVMFFTVIFSSVFNFAEHPVFSFIIEVVCVTFILVFFGEVVPKIYAVQNNIKVTGFVAFPMYISYRILQPLVHVLVKTTSIIDKRITKKGHVLSLDELSHAIEITSDKEAPRQEKSILKGLVNFGNTTVKQVMKPRPDIMAIDVQLNFGQLMINLNDWGYSRLPVFDKKLDTILGVIFIKDLLSYIKENDDFKWQDLMRDPFFVPESKKIDDLLKEFQQKRIHLAIVVDEFGGTSGLITMEDILEEVFGEIHDEFDEDEHIFSKLNDHTFVFEAKMNLNDVCRYLDVDQDVFEEIKNDADTLGGLLLELNGDLPVQGQIITYNNFTFKIESVDKRRIKRVKVTIEPVG